MLKIADVVEAGFRLLGIHNSDAQMRLAEIRAEQLRQTVKLDAILDALTPSEQPPPLNQQAEVDAAALALKESNDEISASLKQGEK